MQEYLWDGITVNGILKQGIITANHQQHAKKILQQKNYYKIEIKAFPTKLLNQPLPLHEIIFILRSFILMLENGISFKEMLAFLVNEKRSLLSQYVFYKLQEFINLGEKASVAFQKISPLFPSIFITFIYLGEQSGNLLPCLQNLEKFYLYQQLRQKKLKQILRYPLTVLSMTVIIFIGLMIFVVPMFNNLYSMLKTLPWITQVMINISNAIRHYGLYIILFGLIFYIWPKIPLVAKIYPLKKLRTKIYSIIESFHDPIIYSYALNLLLEQGVKTQEAIKIAVDCISIYNQKYAQNLIDKLHAGYSFTEGFQYIKWFPKIFSIYLRSAENANQICIGFAQITNYLRTKQEQQFDRWSQIIEPLLMIIIGLLVLLITLAIYLPIFELGNQVV